MLFWLSLAFLILAVVGSIAYAVVKGIDTYRDTKRVLGSSGAELDRITRATAEIELHLQVAASSGTRLEASLARLSASRARLNVLTSAVADVQAAFARATSFVPRK
jgi:hypothetical protein